MKKSQSLKLMLIGLLAMGSTTAFAQRNVGDKFPSGNYVYQVTKAMSGSTPGEVTLIGVREGKNPVEDGALVIPGSMEADLFGDKYSFKVTVIGTNALQYTLDANGGSAKHFANMTTATKVEFPKEISEIPANCFNGYTNVKEITFATGSTLTTINNNAFATTQITKFDFTPCSKLAALPNEAFVEAGKINSYITEVTLPENSKLLKDIEGAFRNLVNLEKINNLEKSSITKVVADAFKNDKKLETIELPGTVQTIEAKAFAGSGVKNLTINVDALQELGDGTTPVYGTVVDDQKVLVNLTLKGNLGGVIKTAAFKDAVNMEKLDLSGLNFISKGQIAYGAFDGCNNAKFTSVTLGDINDEPGGGLNTIDGGAFVNCSKLASVTIGNINSANAIGAQAFGNKLKSVTIGTVKAGAASIKTAAFVFDDVSGATFNLATGEGQYLSSDDASTVIIENAAFDFSAIKNAANADGFILPVIKIGEIRSKGGVFDNSTFALNTSTVKSNESIVVTFTGAIAENGLDKTIFNASGKYVNSLTFEGAIATKGIALGAFSNIAEKMTINFNGSLAETAVDQGAFGALLADSRINYNGTPIDNTVNPFHKQAFKAGSATGDPRPYLLTVADATLKASIEADLKNDGDFDIYLVEFYVEPTPPDNTFVVYRNDEEKGKAWGRYQFGQVKLNSVPKNTDLTIQRVQEVDGGKVKVTLYGTYTDEDDALNTSTIYMVPLKVTNGYYHIGKANTEIIIAKVEKVGGSFSTKKVKINVNKLKADGITIEVPYAAGSESVWSTLKNTGLHIAKNVMTNQQLIDKTAMDGSDPVDIYRGTTDIAEDLYIMTDPAKYNGFRIDKAPIEKNGAYINKGWYYMLLKKYEGGAAAARVIWMDDAEATGIFAVTEKKVVENDAIFTLQGVRVSAPVKGQIYIKNGKKFIAR